MCAVQDLPLLRQLADSGHKLLILLSFIVRRAGFEPATVCLRGNCSTN